MLEPGRQKRTFGDTRQRSALAFSLVLLTALTQSPLANAQTEGDSALAASPTGVSNVSSQDDDSAHFRLGAAIGQAFGFTVFQHVVRLREERTRQELGGAFLRDWFKAVSHTGRNWNDGNKVFTNYVAHPMGGAVYADIYRQNDPRRRQLEVGEPGYVGMVARAMIFAAVVSTQFEIGPVSEASIGNVGMRNPRKMAWVDLVMTPVAGTAWMVGEDLLDQRLLKRMDGTNMILRNTLRLFLNPSRSGANLSRRKWPWFRERDVGPA